MAFTAVQGTGVSIAASLYSTLRPSSLSVSKEIVRLPADLSDSEELFIVTDESGSFLKDSGGKYITYPRSICHQEGIWHRTVGIIVINTKGQMLVQRRSKSKKIRPGALDISAGGHSGTDTDMPKAAKRELWEELFNQDPAVDIDSSRLIRISPEGTFIKNDGIIEPEDKENATFFVYFLNQEEEARISMQKSELQGVFFKDFKTVIRDYLNSQNKDEYAAGFLFFDDYDLKKHINGTPQHLLQLIIDSGLFGNKGVFSDIIIVIDKDGTITERNKPITEDMLSIIINLMSRNIKVVILTGANIENSINFVVRPVAERLKSRDLTSKAKYFKFLYMNGAAKACIGPNGKIKITFDKKPFAPNERRDIFKALAISFIEKLRTFKDFGNKVILGTYAEQIQKTATEAEIIDVFSSFIQVNKEHLGFISLNNNANRLLSIELNNVGKESSNKELHSDQLMREILDSAEKMLKGKLPSKTVYNHGNDFVVFLVQDKAVALREQANMVDMGNPIVIAIGDGRNDYGFLGLAVDQGQRIAFFVGRDTKDIPDNVIIWPVQGPIGTQEILALVGSLIRKPIKSFNLTEDKVVFLNRNIISALRSSA